MASTDIKFGVSKVIITYDLSNNDISAQEIAEASNGVFKTYTIMQNGSLYKLPNTTLETSEIFSAKGAVIAFKQAFAVAKQNKKVFSYCRISRILACEILNKQGYIENNWLDIAQI